MLIKPGFKTVPLKIKHQKKVAKVIVTDCNNESMTFDKVSEAAKLLKVTPACVYQAYHHNSTCSGCRIEFQFKDE